MSRANLLEHTRIEKKRAALARRRQTAKDEARQALRDERALEQRILGDLVGMARRHDVLKRETAVVKALFMRLQKASDSLIEELRAEGLAALAVEDAAEAAAGVPVIIRFPRKLGGRAASVMKGHGLVYGPVTNHWEGIVTREVAERLAAANNGTIEYPAGVELAAVEEEAVPVAQAAE